MFEYHHKVHDFNARLSFDSGVHYQAVGLGLGECNKSTGINGLQISVSTHCYLYLCSLLSELDEFSM
jgi:hypothetical protein